MEDKQIKQVVEQTIKASLEWAQTKDFDLLYRLNAGDEDYLEVHPENRIIKGFSEFRKMDAFFRSDDYKAVRVSIRDLHITLSNNRNVAWWYCELDDINEWKGQPCNWENVRWTGVMELIESGWKIRQMHFSYPEKSE